MSRNDGGPAFPGEPSMRFGQSNEYNQGMTLRDYFAAKALPAVYSDYQKAVRKGEIEADRGWTKEIAILAYEIADAMIAARETK